MNYTLIQWTDHTFNPWIGCAKVSSACKNCYAESIALNKGLVSKWGQGSPRRKTSTANWFTPRKWNEDAKRNQERPKVFCSSMADVFDNEVSPNWRRELFELIEQTESLDWQILTKRPHLIEQQLTEIGYWEKLPLPNVWFGATMEDQPNFDKRWPHLREIPAHVRFCSYEPAMGHITLPEDARNNLHWLIAGGETTLQRNKSRPSGGEWFRSVRDQCEEMKIAFFFKQWGNDLELEDGTRKWHGKTSEKYKKRYDLLDGRTHKSFPCATPTIGGSR